MIPKFRIHGDGAELVPYTVPELFFFAGGRTLCFDAAREGDAIGHWHDEIELLYVTEGSMVEEFNDWCFDSSRKAGDTDIVKTDYGYHIMYYVGRTTPQWEASAFSSLQSSDYSDKYDSLSETYTVTAYEDRFDSIPSIT